MVQTLALNASHDLFINSSGSLTMLSGVEAVAAACVTACLTQFGECVLQTGLGLPNFGLIWVGTPDYALWQSYLQNTILNVEGVTSVQQIRLSAQNNTLSFIADINTIYGPTTVEQTSGPTGAPTSVGGRPPSPPSNDMTWGDGTGITSGNNTQINWRS